jgi:hypothetical protein
MWNIRGLHAGPRHQSDNLTAKPEMTTNSRPPFCYPQVACYFSNLSSITATPTQ